MKRAIVFFLLGALVVLNLGAMRRTTYIQHSMDVSPKVPWRVAGTITDNNDTPDATDWAWSDLATSASGLPDANTVEIEVDERAEYIELRFRSDQDGDAHVIEILVIADDMLSSTLEDVWTLGVGFDLTAGTMVGPNSDVMIDTMTLTVGKSGIITGYEIVDSGNNRQAIVRFATRGIGHILIIATTYDTDSAALTVDKRYFRQ